MLNRSSTHDLRLSRYLSAIQRCSPPATDRLDSDSLASWNKRAGEIVKYVKPVGNTCELCDPLGGGRLAICEHQRACFLVRERSARGARKAATPLNRAVPGTRRTIRHLPSGDWDMIGLRRRWSCKSWFGRLNASITLSLATWNRA